MRNFYKGLLIGLPISLALWAAMLLPAARMAERHPHALAHFEAKVHRAISRAA